MPTEGVCAAHEILYDTVLHLRDNQAQLYDLARESSKKTDETARDVAHLKEAQAAGFERMAKLIAEHRRSRWTPKYVVGLVSAILGSSGIVGAGVFILTTQGVGK